MITLHELGCPGMNCGNEPQDEQHVRHSQRTGIHFLIFPESGIGCHCFQLILPWQGFSSPPVRLNLDDLHLDRGNASPGHESQPRRSKAGKAASSWQPVDADEPHSNGHAEHASGGAVACDTGQSSCTSLGVHSEMNSVYPSRRCIFPKRA